MHKRVKGSQEGGSTEVLWHIERCGENLIFRWCAEQRGYGSQSKCKDTWKLLWMVLYSKFSSVEDNDAEPPCSSRCCAVVPGAVRHHPCAEQ
jgi:hypothetical protein